jgi:uncharacterized membrane protein YphA (DoxX/SURF4 family)
MEVAMNRISGFVAWALAAYIAYIFIWYLQFKFTGDAGSVWLFTVLTDWLGLHGHEKIMRIGTGSAELLASLLLFIPPLQIFGAALACMIMSGAIFFHLVSPLGIDPYGDGGVLFREACLVWVSSLFILAIRRQRVFGFIDRYLPFLPVPARIRSL